MRLRPARPDTGSPLRRPRPDQLLQRPHLPRRVAAGPNDSDLSLRAQAARLPEARPVGRRRPPADISSTSSTGSTRSSRRRPGATGPFAVGITARRLTAVEPGPRAEGLHQGRGDVEREADRVVMGRYAPAGVDRQRRHGDRPGPRTDRPLPRGHTRVGQSETFSRWCGKACRGCSASDPPAGAPRAARGHRGRRAVQGERQVPGRSTSTSSRSASRRALPLPHPVRAKAPAGPLRRPAGPARRDPPVRGTGPAGASLRASWQRPDSASRPRSTSRRL